jgi:hypothetical protein
MFDQMEKSIDAVMVAIPDHTHAVATMAAIKRGKHVFRGAVLRQAEQGADTGNPDPECESVDPVAHATTISRRQLGSIFAGCCGVRFTAISAGNGANVPSCS